MDFYLIRAVFRTINRRSSARAGACIGAMLLCGSALAQSATVIGNNQYGRDCFLRAEQAVSFNAATKWDVEVCSRALEDLSLSRSDRAATLVNRGILELANGEPIEAKASYDEALSLVDNKGETHINIGNIYVHQKRYHDAISEYSKGIEKTSRRPHVAFLNRGLAFEYLKDYEAATTDYTRAVELAPEWVRAKKMLARATLKRSSQREKDASPHP